MTDPERDKPLRTFGRTRGRRLSDRQRRRLETDLPRLAVPLGRAGDLDPKRLFPAAREVWLEIGFGGGEHLTGQAARHPDIGFIGCEPFIDGMAKALQQIEAVGLENIRLHMDDARQVIDALADASIDRLFILFPDPWPKKRQQKRRLLQPDLIASVRRILRPGGRFRFATDVASYANEALLNILQDGGFDWGARRADDWRRPPADHIRTRYEAKRLGDCAPVWFDFARNEK